MGIRRSFDGETRSIDAYNEYNGINQEISYGDNLIEIKYTTQELEPEPVKRHTNNSEGNFAVLNVSLILDSL